MGATTITHLAAHAPQHIFFTGRNQTAADKLILECRSQFNTVPIDFVQCDLTSLASVKAAAENLLTRLPERRLDIAILNAGIMAVPAATTKDGYEIQFGTNHLGHALLAQLLLPALMAAPAPRLVTLTSTGYALHPKSGISYGDIKTDQNSSPECGGMTGAWVRYGQSKLANILYTNEMGRRHPRLTTAVVHPGVIADNGLVQNLSWPNRLLIWVTTMGKRLTPEQGAYNSCWAATCPKEQLEGAVFVEPVGEKGTIWGSLVTSEEKARELYDWTEDALKAYV